MTLTYRSSAPTTDVLPTKVPIAVTDPAPVAGANPTVRQVPVAVPMLRIATGFVFLWAFFDKFFGLGFSTARANAWINGGSPTRGFLSHVAVGPFESMMHSWAGQWWANWLFMMGLLGIGLSLVFGVAMRLFAGAAVIMMALMWMAEWPLARHTSAGEASGSTNPLVDYHVIYALSAVAMASLAGAGDRWGLGRQWRSLPVVRDHRWLQ